MRNLIFLKLLFNGTKDPFEFLRDEAWDLCRATVFRTRAKYTATAVYMLNPSSFAILRSIEGLRRLSRRGDVAGISWKYSFSFDRGVFSKIPDCFASSASESN